MGVQIAKHGKAPKQSRARVCGDLPRTTVKRMNVAPRGGWNQTREENRRWLQIMARNARKA